MRLRYYIGAFAALLLTACSVEVDLDESSQFTIKGINAHSREKVFMTNGQTGFGVVFDQSGKADVLNGTYDLLYIASELDIIKLNDYEKGSFDEAHIKYKNASYAADELDHIFTFHKTGITLPGTKEVSIAPKQITAEYKLRYGGTDSNAPAQLHGNLHVPSTISALSGTSSGDLNESFNVSFKLDKAGTVSVKLPKGLPSTLTAYMDYDKKEHTVNLSSNTIVIE